MPTNFLSVIRSLNRRLSPLSAHLYLRHGHVYPPKSVGWAWERYRRTDAWKAKAKSTREKDWDWAWKWLGPAFADLDPATIEIEMMQELRAGILEDKGLHTAHRVIKMQLMTDKGGSFFDTARGKSGKAVIGTLSKRARRLCRLPCPAGAAGGGGDLPGRPRQALHGGDALGDDFRAVRELASPAMPG